MTKMPPQPGTQDARETGRVEAFSDGVFGIAVTLLVLDLKVPRAADLAGQTSLGAALIRQWPTYVSYVLSFLTVLIMWTNHHRLFQVIRRTDRSFLMINGLLLMFVTLVPFPTAVLAEHIGHDGAGTAAAFYSGTFVMIGLLFNVLWWYAAHRGRLVASGHEREATSISRQYRFGPALYLAAFLLAFLNVAASVGLCGALAGFFAWNGRKKAT